MLNLMEHISNLTTVFFWQKDKQQGFQTKTLKSRSATFIWAGTSFDIRSPFFWLELERTTFNNIRKSWLTTLLVWMNWIWVVTCYIQQAYLNWFLLMAVHIIYLSPRKSGFMTTQKPWVGKTPWALWSPHDIRAIYMSMHLTSYASTGLEVENYNAFVNDVV